MYFALALSILYNCCPWVIWCFPDSTFNSLFHLLWPLPTAWVSIKKTFKWGSKANFYMASAGLMVGFEVGCSGQVYQTGADSYCTVILRLCFLLPWLYRWPNIKIAFAFNLYYKPGYPILFFKQTFWARKISPIFYLCSKSIKSCAVWICQKKYTALRLFLLLGLLVTQITGMIQFYQIEIPYLISAFSRNHRFYYFFNKDDPVVCQFNGCFVLGVTATIWLVDGINQLFKRFLMSLNSTLLIAGIIFTWFALISYFLIKIFPSKPFYIIQRQLVSSFAGPGACSVVFLGNISLIIGIIFVAAAITLLTKSRSYFIRQFILFICEVDRLLFIPSWFPETRSKVHGYWLPRIFLHFMYWLFFLSLTLVLLFLIQMLATWYESSNHLMDHSLWIAKLYSGLI